MRPSITRLAVLSACLGAAALPVAAEAGGYHMSREFSPNGQTAHAYGKICTDSKYGKWRWRASVGSGDMRVNYRWTEPIFADGKPRNLTFTHIGGPFVERQSEALRPLILSSAKRVLNKMTVRTAAGRKNLSYTTPFGNSTIPFKPVRGC